ncbi:transposase [Caldanaerobacter subterraneus subsp. tengcongensis MB4]|jgi:transposase|uniref:Transposase n=7 Tax=Caldanaerobacter subterraneus TaxID=911092 RepID=Q8R6J5_CALS4|nr:IS110 family transposase [Caldanaerobacter subterraneus]AAM23454.1 transposase [Caldanaerobacter subterraneus subsp. tengcongensis MB4]AAM23535.1 transposase [Caldanaerobacter subterraneus subsp. tengcongensis MB4]AAM24402.1 transposase [Caldanaerobacter subterraneus subsp. tengcongensis MB4]MCS3916044.1 transposase [Caldanaerobacter subterraneus subsp. tengcongensis MB4]MCS3916169.1 transposase [Caldanaerobacter subterraneus subsp. tengcongensis MB4]
MNKVQKLLLVHSSDIIFVGVDVAKKTHYARIINHIGLEVIKPFKFNNSIDGYERLVSKILEAKEKSKATKILIGFEPSGHYWKPLAWFLKEKGYTVVIVNPYHVKQRKEEEDNSPSKNDRKDALIIARLIKEGKFLNCLLPQNTYADLRNLSVARKQLIKKLNSVKNKIIAILDEYFPEFEEVFKNLWGKAALWILRNCPFPSIILKLSKEEIAEQLKKATNNRVGMKRAEKLIEAAKKSIGVKEGIKGAQIRLNIYLDELEFLKTQLETIEKAMEELLKKIDIAEYLLSIPGIGVITVAGFLAEVGDIGKYTHYKQIQKLGGLNITDNQSGKHRGKTKISKRGRPELRNLLYKASLTLVAKNKEFKALYNYFLRRRENPLEKKQALIAISIKLIRVMFTLAKKKEKYDSQKVLGEYRMKQIKELVA